MLAQHLVGGAHQRRDRRAHRALGQQRGDGLAQMVVRLGKVRFALRPVRRVNHADMAEGRRDMDGKTERRGKRRKARVMHEILHELNGLLALDAPAVVGEDARRLKRLALKGAEVDAQARLARLQHDAHARRLQRGAPGIACARVVAENREDGGVAARRHARGHGLAQAEPAPGQAVDLRQGERRQRRFAAQLRNGFVRNAVPDDQHIFHDAIPPSLLQKAAAMAARPPVHRGAPGRQS